MSNLSEEDLNALDRIIEEIEQKELEEQAAENKNDSTNNPPERLSEDQFKLDVDESTIRFSSATWFDKIQEFDVTLGGCGGIGSYVAYLLARLKPFRVTLYDDDTVERVNMAGQMFSSEDIGRPKVTAIVNKMIAYSNFYSYISVEGRITPNSPITNVVLCGFDNMVARKDTFDNWLQKVRTLALEEQKEEFERSIFIDGRLAAEKYQVIAIRASDDDRIKEYRDKYLFNDDQAESEICSFKQTAFMANQIASTMINVLVNHAANLVYGVEARSVPFFTSYSASTMLFKTE